MCNGEITKENTNGNVTWASDGVTVAELLLQVW